MQIVRNDSSIIPRPCVAAIGFFDGVHRGHRFLIRQVRRLAAERGMNAALLTFSEHPRKVMDATHRLDLLTTFDEKMALLEETGVDYCLLIDFTPQVAQLTAEEFMEKVLKGRFNVQCLVVGYDHRFGHNRSEGFDEYVCYGKRLGIEVVHAAASGDSFPLADGSSRPISSSLIRELLHKGEVAEAARCLGYRYFLEGTVVAGRRVGHKLGFPTANLCVGNADKLVPAHGVYAVRVTVGGLSYKGMLNIGCRPTLDNGSDCTIEAHLLDFSGNLYGKLMRIEFVEWVRKEMRFDSVEGLVAQLQKDKEKVEKMPEE